MIDVVMTKIRLAITMLTIISLFTGLVACAVDAKTTSSTGTGKTITTGTQAAKTTSAKTVKAANPSAASAQNPVTFINTNANGAPTLGTQLSLFGVNHFSGFTAPSSAFAVPADTASAFSQAQLIAGPTATGSSLAIPDTVNIAADGTKTLNPGFAYSTGLSTEGVRLSSLNGANGQLDPGTTGMGYALAIPSQGKAIAKGFIIP